MAFFDYIGQTLGVDINELLSGARVTLFCGRGAHIEGHKGIWSVAGDEIVLKSRKGRIVIKGKKLVLNEISSTDVYIAGKVECVECRV